VVLACGALLSLAGCELWVGERIPSLPSDKPWQVLPLRALLSRPSIRAEVIEFCRVESCGYDAAVGRFAASGQEAGSLEASLTDPVRLGRLVAEPPGKAKPARIKVEPFKAGDWQGARLAITGEKRQAFGVVLERRQGIERTFIVIVAAKPGVARALALAAAS
jgi:hypothetical protein